MSTDAYSTTVLFWEAAITTLATVAAWLLVQALPQIMSYVGAEITVLQLRTGEIVRNIGVVVSLFKWAAYAREIKRSTVAI